MTFYRPRLPLFSATVLTLLTAGCAVGPNFHAPAPPEVSRFTPDPLPAATASASTPGGERQSFVQGQDVAGRWWEAFGSSTLDALVERALTRNVDLDAARAALRVARETYLAQKGAFLPTVDVGYSIAREQASNVLAPPLTSNNNLFTLHTAQVTVGFIPDVFGGLRRQTESVAAQVEAQRFESEAVYLTLTTNLVSAVILEASLKDQIAATRRVVEIERKVTTALRAQKAAGQIAGLDVAVQEAALAQAEQALPVLEKQRAQQRDLIASLTGGYPSETPDPDVALATLSLPTQLPVSLPSRLVEQRPDVRAALANLHAASAQIGVAIANRLPAFDLSANAGGASTNLGALFAGGAPFYVLTGAVTQPIFHGGILLHRQRAARATFDQAAAQYRSTVLDGFQNVADTLQALQADSDALAKAADAERASATALQIVRRQQRLGQVNGITFLISEQTYQQALITRIQAQASRYSDTVALFQAFGGGWQARRDF